MSALEPQLVFLRFDRGTVIYTPSFEIKVNGTLWPREMRAAMQIIDIYKEQNKETNSHNKGTGA